MKKHLALFMILSLVFSCVSIPAFAGDSVGGGADKGVRRFGRHTRAAKPRLNLRRADVDQTRVLAVPYADVSTTQLRDHFKSQVATLGKGIRLLVPKDAQHQVAVVKTPASLAVDVAQALADSALYASVDYDQISTDFAYTATPDDAHHAKETADFRYFDSQYYQWTQSTTWALRSFPGARFDAVWPQLSQIRPAAAAPVAVIDSGIYMQHEDIANSNIIAKYDFGENDNDPSPEPGTDGAAHGTHTAGIIGQQSNNGFGYASAGFDAQVFFYKTKNAQGLTYSSSVINALLQAKKDGARVINMSFGFTAPPAALEDACNELAAAGVLLVAAAGNHNGTSLRWPAAYRSVISVAALDHGGSRASFSAYGTGINIAAPGMQLGYATYGNGKNAYTSGNGTSYAAPLVAAALSLLIRADAYFEQDRPAHAQALIRMLYDTAHHLSVGGLGVGALDAKAAFDEVLKQQVVTSPVTLPVTLPAMLPVNLPIVAPPTTSPLDPTTPIISDEVPVVPVLKSSKITSLKSGKHRLTVRFKKVASATQYQLRYRIGGAKKWKTKTYSFTTRRITLKGLKKTQRYQVQVRAIQRLATGIVYSVWSKTKVSKRIK